MGKQRLVFIGHSYHRQTRSSQFFLDLLAPFFEVHLLWNDSWKPGGAPVSISAINSLQPDHVIFWQLLPSRRALRQLECTNITWVPMRDGTDYVRGRHERLAGSGYKILCFCQELCDHFSGLGFDTLPVQYFPAVDTGMAVRVEEDPSVFLWTRRNEIAWPQLKSLLGAQRPKRIILRYAPDPGMNPEMPSDLDLKAYGIEVVDGWLSENDYRALRRSCNLFVAPRPLEGIGLALLEAMADGQVPLVPNAPTMNEYVRHRDNGFVYDLSNPAALDLTGLPALQSRARADMVAGHAQWQTDVPRMLEFIRRPPRQGADWWWRLRGRLFR